MTTTTQLNVSRCGGEPSCTFQAWEACQHPRMAEPRSLTVGQWHGCEPPPFWCELRKAPVLVQLRLEE